MADLLEDREQLRNRFHRLLGELSEGNLARNAFQPWEIAILLDFREIRLPSKRRTEILQQYRRAATRQIESGGGPPMTLSEFLAIREKRRQALRAAAPGVPLSGIPHSERCESPRCRSDVLP
jgi:hypothetical protein